VTMGAIGTLKTSSLEAGRGGVLRGQPTTD
jgi:hypothetical protein